MIVPCWPNTIVLTIWQKIRERQLAAPAESETLQELVINELKTKKHAATEGLVWLVRYVISIQFYILLLPSLSADMMACIGTIFPTDVSLLTNFESQS